MVLIALAILYFEYIYFLRNYAYVLMYKTFDMHQPNMYLFMLVALLKF